MREHDCEEFMEFVSRYGDDLANSILESICCRETVKTDTYQVISIHSENRDREGANCVLTGTVKVGVRHFMFTINDGNWNGTEIVEWERCSGKPMKSAPTPGPWIFADVMAISVRMKLDGIWPLLSRMTSEFMRAISERN